MKLKREHTILKEFEPLLMHIQTHPKIKRIIPGRIARQQKGSSALLLHFSYETISGLKYKMCKGSTAQEVFIVCDAADSSVIKSFIEESFKKI